MEFEVDVPRLALVPHALNDLAHDAYRCMGYAEEAFDFDLGPGVLNAATGRHADVRALVTGYFQKIALEAQRMSRAIDKSVRFYEKGDLVLAAEWDALLPSSGRDPGSRFDGLNVEIQQANRRPHGEPLSRLKPLQDYRPEWPHEPEWADLLSPTNICRDAMMGVNWLAVQIGVADRIVDPLDFLAVPWFGNWAGMKACSDALRNLSAACGELWANWVWAELRVNAVWRGNAADAAWMRLNAFAKNIEAGAPILERLSRAYADVVDEMATLEPAMEGLVSDVIDSAVLALLATVTAATVAGPVAVAAARTVKIVDTMNDLDKAGQYVDLLRAVVALFQGKFDEVGTLDIDMERYEHLEVEHVNGVLHERL